MAFLKKRTSFKKTSFVVNTEYKHQTYDVSSKGHTLFRVFPAPSLEKQGEWQEQVVPVDAEPLSGLSDSFCEVEMVNWWGKDKLSLITSCTDIDGEETLSPAAMFYNVIEDFVKTGKELASSGMPFSKAVTDWKGWFVNMGIATFPQTRFLLQGVLMEHAGKPCVNKNNQVCSKVPIVLCVNRSATMDMEDNLVTKLDENADLSAVNSRMGDITSITGGSAIIIQSYLNTEGRTRYKVGRQADQSGAAVITPLDPQMVLAHFKPWEELLNIQPAAWQIAKIAEQFSPEAADFAFREDAIYSSMLPAGVAGSYAAKYESGDAQTPQQTQTGVNNPPMQTVVAAPAQTAQPVQQTVAAPVQTAQPTVATLTAEVVEDAPEATTVQQAKPVTAATTPTNSVVAAAMAELRGGK